MWRLRFGKPWKSTGTPSNMPLQPQSRERAGSRRFRAPLAAERHHVRRRRDLGNLRDVLAQPTGQLLAVKSARRDGEHQAFLIIDRGMNVIAI